jgi:Cupredoxin-like domain
LYTWWVFVHIVGVFAFLVSHGTSIAVTFRLRSERDPRRIVDLLTLSSSSVMAMYASIGVLLLGGVVAGFLGHWWGQAWIWVSLGLLVAISVAMRAVASPYYRRVGLVARAKVGGSEAVTDEQLDRLLLSGRPLAVAGIGLGGLVLILYLMMFKPALGLGGEPAEEPEPGTLAISALPPLRFDADSLTVPASAPFDLRFDNQEPGVPHNVAVYTDDSASTSLFVGEVITGPATIIYEVEALDPGSYFFRCDLHPTQMVGTLTAG